jgi:hypothetical protein
MTNPENILRVCHFEITADEKPISKNLLIQPISLPLVIENPAYSK